MSEKLQDTQLQSMLFESSKGMAELLKSAAHPARMQILVLLCREENEFSQLMQQTALSKTALANHLNQLVSNRLVEKIERGKYSITVDGRELLTAAATAYRNSALREAEHRELLSKRYAKGMLEGKNMTKKVISKKVEYLPCWLSYTGAIGGSLRALGVNCDTVDVGGYSGYAFIINVSKGTTCPSGPTALPFKTWTQIHKGTETLGWKLEHFDYPGGYPAKEGSPTPKEIEVARKLFERIKREIDEEDKPVVLWGLVVPEYGIVKGYEGDSYIVSTFRSLTNQPEDPILYHDLKAPGCLEAFFFRQGTKRQSSTVDKDALERAIKFAVNVPTFDKYIGGPAALDEWARVLETATEKEQNYHGNSYVGACTCEGRSMSAEFLKRLAQKHPGKQAKHLLNAAASYEKGWRLMKEFTQIFPFKFQGDMKLETRKKGATLLRQVKVFEETAIEHMEKAVNEWSN